jgi:mannose-6-phosphate isomerase
MQVGRILALATIERVPIKKAEDSLIRLSNPTQPYLWGSTTAIPELLGFPCTSGPVAESWMGAHPSAPSRVITAKGETGLDQFIAADADVLLGSTVVSRFGPALPYLLKILAAHHPLSLQVHPDIEQARRGYASEEAAGIPPDAPRRNYRDGNHKPELVYALTPFEALCGFRPPLRVVDLLKSLEAPLAKQMYTVLTAQPTSDGIRTVLTQLLEPSTRPSADEVLKVAQMCAARLAQGSPYPAADRVVVMLADAYPGDPGVVTSLLLNALTLQPGDAMFVPAGSVHAYLHGMAIEVMASSDNVLRAGLTPKHVDVDELLGTVNYDPGPPTLIAPQDFNVATKVFRAAVDDFELSLTAVEDEEVHPLPGGGPRILLCLDGAVTITSSGHGATTLAKGESLFAPASDGGLTTRGRGSVVQAYVP